MTEKLDRVCVFGLEADSPELPIVEGAGSAHAIVWPGVGAEIRSIHRISLGGGARTTEMNHPMEAVYYIIEGSGSVGEPSEPGGEPLVEGSMIFVEPNTAYVIRANDGGIELMGGPCPPDPALYAHL